MKLYTHPRIVKYRILIGLVMAFWGACRIVGWIACEYVLGHVSASAEMLIGFGMMTSLMAILAFGWVIATQTQK